MMMMVVMKYNDTEVGHQLRQESGKLNTEQVAKSSTNIHLKASTINHNMSPMMHNHSAGNKIELRTTIGRKLNLQERGRAISMELVLILVPRSIEIYRH